MKDQGYIKSLDGVRALAILIVMSFHSGIIHFGWMGVQLFFVLSGYLITGILWKEKFRERSLRTKLKNFWARRSLRIFPLYFGFLLAIALIFLFTGFPGYFPSSAPYLFTYTYNYTRLVPHWQGNPLFTHLWSLSIEEQFYLFYPLVIFFLRPSAIRIFLVVCILLSPLSRFLLFQHYQTIADPFSAADAVYWNTLSHLDAFFLGGLIPLMGLETAIKKPANYLYISLSIVIVAGIVNYFITGASSFFFTDLGYDHDRVGNGAPVWRYSVLDLLFASLILCLTTQHANGFGRLRNFFSNRYLARVGKVSYGMYIFHWAVFVYIFARFNPSQNAKINLLLFIPYVIAVYLVAEVSYRLYESRFLLLKDRLFPMKDDNKKVENTSETVDPRKV
ncbi:MAG: acyltransferase family protein [Flavisolibacter sp.]